MGHAWAKDYSLESPYLYDCGESNDFLFNFYMGMGGVEPPTPRASIVCSPAELHSRET